MNERLWWYVSRSSGLVAWVLLAASTLWGLALTTRALAARAGLRRWLLDLHRFLSGLSVAFVAVHVSASVADTFVHFGIADVLVPLASSWHPGWVAWGIVAMYLLVAVELTSLLRRHLAQRLWRSVHTLSFVLFVVATVHVLLAGPDTHAWARWPVIVTSMAVAFLAMTRTVAPDRDRSRLMESPTRHWPVPVPAGTHGPQSRDGVDRGVRGQRRRAGGGHAAGPRRPPGDGART